jgi:hypothetical protein
MNEHEGLLARIRFVRHRWRLQNLVKGVAILSVLTGVLLILGIWGADLFGFTPASVWIIRILTAGVILFVATRFVYSPLRRNISDIQVAQFIEERYPKLEDRLVAAVEYGGSAGESGMVDLVIRDALDKSDRVDFSVFAHRKKLIAYGAAAAMAILTVAALLLWGPPFFPYGFERLYEPWTEVAGPAALMIEVSPGDREINRGEDQQIQARLVGFDTPDVKLFTQSEGSSAWVPSAMEPQPRGNGFLYLLIDIQSPLRYYVEAGGVRSMTHRLRVVERPGVERIDLTYHFPPYTGMDPQVVENEGDIMALKGTRVELRVHLTQPAESAQIILDDGSKVDLSRAPDGDFGGSVTVSRSGSYHVQLATARAGTYSASPEYGIDAVEDAPPRISIIKPMRDIKATSVEEVFTEVRAEDDIGLGKVELHYSVNGEPEKSVSLHNGKPTLGGITGSHTFFLEELDLQPGDLISYYGKAWDNKNIGVPNTTSSDMYFIQVRPFEQRYVQSQQGQLPGGEGGAEQALSRQQRDIIAATFRLIRDGTSMEPKEYTDGMKSLALVQTRLQGQAQGVVERMQRRGAASADDNFSQLTEYLANAVTAMESAAIQLGAQKPSEALPEEQKALQQLMRAESLFREIQISFGAQSGRGSDANAEDLAELFELELNKLKNQYETVQRGEERARDQQLDEAMQRLKELARRQQQLNQRSLQLGRKGSAVSGSSGTGQGQQQLLEEAARLQRQLQRLSRERSSPDLDRVSGQLQRAIEEMKKSLDRSRRGEGQAAAAEGIRALQQLEDAGRRLASSQDAALGERLDRAVDESGRLLEDQKRIADDVERLRRESAGAEGPEARRRSEDAARRNSELAGRLKGLADQLSDLARQVQPSQKETGDRLAEAAGTIRDRRLPERISASSRLLQNGMYDLAQSREGYIRAGLEQLNRMLESAKASLGQSREGKLEEAYDRTRQLAEGLESMQQRLHGQGTQRGQGNRAPAGETQARPDEARPSPDGVIQGTVDSRASLPTGLGGTRDDEARQLRRELQQRLADAEDLRKLLDRNATRIENLDQVISSLRLMQRIRALESGEDVARLGKTIELLRQLELDLGRELDKTGPRGLYQQADDNDAPQDYRKLVEEYYKALARGRPQ